MPLPSYSIFAAKLHVVLAFGSRVSKTGNTLSSRRQWEYSHFIFCIGIRSKQFSFHYWNLICSQPQLQYPSFLHVRHVRKYGLPTDSETSAEQSRVNKLVPSLILIVSEPGYDFWWAWFDWSDYPFHNLWGKMRYSVIWVKQLSANDKIVMIAWHGV